MTILGVTPAINDQGFFELGWQFWGCQDEMKPWVEVHIPYQEGFGALLRHPMHWKRFAWFQLELCSELSLCVSLASWRDCGYDTAKTGCRHWPLLSVALAVVSDVADIFCTLDRFICLKIKRSPSQPTNTDITRHLISHSQSANRSNLRLAKQGYSPKIHIGFAFSSLKLP